MDIPLIERTFLARDALNTGHTYIFLGLGSKPCHGPIGSVALSSIQGPLVVHQP